MSALCSSSKQSKPQGARTQKISEARLLVKTQRCKYYLRGKCTRGDACCYVHDAPTGLPQRPCFAFAHKNYCRHGDDCKFSHDIKERVSKALVEEPVPVNAAVEEVPPPPEKYQETKKDAAVVTHQKIRWADITDEIDEASSSSTASSESDVVAAPTPVSRCAPAAMASTKRCWADIVDDSEDELITFN